jgi:macrolide-specific efflux system membrane fusion protein
MSGWRPLVVAVSAAVFLGSCFLVPREEEVLAPPLAEPPQIRYRTHTVATGTIENAIQAFGVFTYASQSDLSFEKRGGRLQTLHVRIGDEVVEGQIIAELYTNTIETEIAQAELSRRRAALALRKAEDEYDTEYSLALANADVRLAQIRLEAAQEALSLEESLAGLTGESGESLNGLRRAVTEAEISLEKSQLHVQRLERADTPLALALAQIDLESASLRLEQLNDELELARLRAPMDGTITWVSPNAVAGEYLEAFQRFVRIADPRDIVFEYRGRDSGSFRVGMECTVTAEDVDYPGTVVLTESSVPFDLREEFDDTVQIRIPGLPDTIGAGRTGRATLVLARREDVLFLPKRAVQRYSTRTYVNVLAGGVGVERDVEVGLETATEMEIVSGLEEGEEVILR